MSILFLVKLCIAIVTITTDCGCGVDLLVQWEWYVKFAAVAELADAHGSGPCIRKDVGVQVPSAAGKRPYLNQQDKNCWSWWGQED